MIYMIPSLSILLPCHNEEKLLPRQLAAILSQLAPNDELVFLDDGSTDGTCAIMAPYRKMDNFQVLSHNDAMGVNAAYNFCASKATKEWCLGCSGNDEVQQGAIAA